MELIIKKIRPSDFVKRMKNEDILLIDIRSAQEHKDEHIEGAFNIPLEEFANKDFSDDHGKVAVLYCRGGYRTAQATGLLQNQSFKEILILEGGIAAWKAKGLTTKKTTRAPIDIMRQVQVIAGSLVFLGVILGFFLNPVFLLISGFVGAGLVLAGVFGFCGMARVLSLMPWNKRTTS